MKIRTTYLVWGLCQVVLLGLCSPAQSATEKHPDLDDRIMDLSSLIEADPQNAKLYFDRGKLYLQHEEFEEAIADLECSLNIDSSQKTVRLAFAKALLKGGYAKQSKLILDEYLVEFPGGASALVTRAQALAQLGSYLESASDYTQVIMAIQDPTPDLYIARSESFAQAGEDFVQRAIDGLDEGIEWFGAIVTLELYAVDLEVQLSQFDSALDRLELIAKQSPRKERYHIERAKVLELAGRTTQAKSAYKAGLLAVESLPFRIRNTKAMKELAEFALNALGQESEKGLSDSVNEQE